MEPLLDPAGEAGESFGFKTANFFRQLFGMEKLEQPGVEVDAPEEGLLKRAFLPSYPTVKPAETVAPAPDQTVVQKPAETVAPQPKQVLPMVPPAGPKEPEGFGGRYREAREGGRGVLGSAWRGLGFGKTVGEGMNADAETLGAATDQALEPVAKRLPQSDAELGPLSTLTASGRAIPATLAAGVVEGAPVLQAAVSEMLAGIGLPLLGAPDTLPTARDAGAGSP